MKFTKAQVEAILFKLKQCVFDANLYDLGWADYPHAENSAKFRKKYVKLLESMGVEVPVGLKQPPATIREKTKNNKRAGSRK